MSPIKCDASSKIFTVPLVISSHCTGGKYGACGRPCKTAKAAMGIRFEVRHAASAFVLLRQARSLVCSFRAKSRCLLVRIRAFEVVIVAFCSVEGGYSKRNIQESIIIKSYIRKTGDPKTWDALFSSPGGVKLKVGQVFVMY